jgi:hypothetical protein
MAARSQQWLRSLVGIVIVLGLLLLAQQAFAQGNPTQPREIELVGEIQTVNAGMITVNSLVVDLIGAEVKATLEVGIDVRVQGELLADGTIQAREVDLADAGLMPGEFELVGTLDSIGTGMMVVSGLEFNTVTAEVQAGLVAGDLVKVHAMLLDDLTRVAREVERFAPGPQGGADNANDNASDDNGNDNVSNDNAGGGAVAAGDEVEITGTLDQIGDGFIVVSGQTIDTTQAAIKDALVFGALVKVHLSIVDGAMVAREVEFAHQDDGQFQGGVGDDNSNSNDNAGADNGNDNASADNGNDNAGGDNSNDNSASGGGACEFGVENSSVNLRSGPGTGSPVAGYGFEHDRYPVVATHESGDWLQVQHPALGSVWVAVSVGELRGGCGGLPTTGQPVLGGDDNSNGNDNDSAGNDNSDDHGNDNAGNVNGNDNSGGNDDGSGHDTGDDHGGGGDDGSGHK